VSPSGRVRLTNTSDVRGLELTLSPEGGLEVLGIEPTRRTRGFTLEQHQAAPGEPVKLVIVALDGRPIRAGRGPVARLKLRRQSGARLRVTEVQAAE
jgi:hypothetical protein